MRVFKLFAIISLFILSVNCNITPCQAKILSGNVNKEDYLNSPHIVIDGLTGKPLSGAQISIPAENIRTYTNALGRFKLDAFLKKPAILSVKANGYKPFSLTIDKQKMKSPLIIVVTKQFPNEIIIDSEIHHLGDNKYSINSANAGDFSLRASSPYFFKEFYLDDINSNLNNFVIKIGSIIGIDTEAAKRLNQSKIITSSSSPVQIFLNSQKIGEININGDEHTLFLPRGLLRRNAYNTLRIETGINIKSNKSIDYDDIEFMNLLLVAE